MREKRNARAAVRARGRHFRPAELSCLISAVLAAGATELAFAREVPFSGFQQITNSTSQARSVRPADMDGDGDPDSVVASQNNDLVAWYENDGSAGGWAIHTITTGADEARDAFPADVDGDGDLDVVAASSYDDTIAWHENTSGDGSTWTAHVISTGIDRAKSVYVADLDGDGDLDVISQSTAASTVYWHENGSAGGTWTQHVVRTGISYAYNVSAADVDGDGDIDALAAARDSDSVFWFQNDGSGGTWAIGTVTNSADSAVTTGTADIDGDGDLDVLSGSYLDDKIAWYENDGSGGGWAIHTVVAASGDARLVFPSDVDSDGDMDLITDFSGTSWFENDGTGTNWTTHTVSGSSYNSVMSTDIDVDGDLDMLVAGGNYVSFFTNDTIHRSGLFPEQQVVSTAGQVPQSVTLADIDGDGDRDVVSVSFSNFLVAWHENDGTPGDGGWQTRTVAQNGYYSLRSVRAADIDGDGDLDLAVASSNNDSRVLWFENDGTPSDGGWITHTITIAADWPHFAHPADIDRDGHVDVLVPSRDDDTIAWHRNDGTPTDGGWTALTISTSATSALNAVTADIDRDGDTDVVAALRGADAISWYENDGTPLDGGWITHTITTNASAAYQVVVADVDGDGDMDAVSASRGDGKVAWYENDGTPGDGGWITHTISTGVVNTFTVFAGDTDNDGDVDVISASAVNDEVIWFENDGTPVDGGWQAHTLSANPDFPSDVSLGDVDGDGDLDVLSASGNDDTIAWYENRGGQFGLPTLSTAQKIVNNGTTHDLLDIQAIHRGRSGDSDAELVTLELKLTDGAGVDLTNSEADNLIEELRVYLDDGNGVFDGAPADMVVHTVSGFSLVAGVQTVSFSDGNANAQLPFGSPKVYFVVADITANADTQTPSAFQVGHVTESSSTGEDAPNDIPLTLEFWPNTGTGVVDTALSTSSCQAPFDLALSNRTVTTTVACQAGTFIRAGDAFVVGSGGNLSLTAGQTIRFTSGFHVDTGTLTVTIEPLLAP